MNHIELRSARLTLGISSAEAALNIGKCAVRTWLGWEIGQANVPFEVEISVYSVLSLRAYYINSMMMEKRKEMGALETYQAYVREIGLHNNPTWRDWIIARSARAEAFARGYISLIPDYKPLPPVSMRHQK